MATTTRTTSNVPVYFTPEMYPASPLLSFPATLAGRKVNERAGIDLRVKTNFGASADAARSPVRNVQPHNTKLPRRRNPKKFPVPVPSPILTEKGGLDDEQKSTPKRVGKVGGRHPGPRVNKADQYASFSITDEVLPPRLTDIMPDVPRPEDSDHMQMVVPNICVAFSDGEPAVAGNLPLHQDLDGRPWTHTITISYPDEDGSLTHNGTCEQWFKDGVQRLHLVLPTSSHTQLHTTGRRGLGLTDAQLRTARDFLAQACPHSVPEMITQQDNAILITAPYGRPTDAMCALLAFLAMKSEWKAESILRLFDDCEFDSVWKGEVSEDECDRVQKIACSWSWTNQVKKPITPGSSTPQ